MKALLIWHQTPFRKTHDLDDLKPLCLTVAPEAETQLEGIGRLAQ